MSIVFAVQVLVILSFMYSVRMKVWQTSLNSFVFISCMFVLTISREIQYFQDIWVNYHAFIVGVALIFVMGRLSYQSFYKKYKELICNDCANYNRRSTDLK